MINYGKTIINVGANGIRLSKLQLFRKSLTCISRNNSTSETLDECYIRTKQLCECKRPQSFILSFHQLRLVWLIYAAKKLPPDVNKKGVFACNRLDLKEIDVYGFDYDYTLACYKPVMGDVLYNLGAQLLVNIFSITRTNSNRTWW